MSALHQIAAVTGMNLRSLPGRLSPSLVIVFGIAVVVAVFISVLAMAHGFTDSAVRTGHLERAMVIGRGAPSEISGGFSREQAKTMMEAPGVRRTADNQPIASAEHLAFVPLTDRRTGRDAFVIIRGVGPQAFALRPEIKLVEGRSFRPAVHELIVGRALQRRIAGLAVGSHVLLPQGEWTVVGIFESGRDAHESELLTDADTLMSALDRNLWFNSMTVRLESAQAFQTFKDAITTNPTLEVDVRRERDYFAETSANVGRYLKIIAWFIGGVMALGAVFAALNTMHSAISARTLEIATLRAMGYGAAPVVISVFVEALLLSLCGAVIGAAAAWFVFNGSDVTTATGNMPTQLTYALNVDVRFVLAGAGCACLVGLIGGLFPAIRAVRMPVAIGVRPV